MSRLVVVEGPLKGKIFEVTELASIGRGDTCAVRLDGRHISRIHARMERKDGGVHIKDNGSRNGIFVNGASVKEAVLKPDDELEIGEHVLVFDPASDPDRRPRASALETLAEPFAPAAGDDRLPALLAAASAVAALDDEREIARTLLDALLSAIRAERGFVMTADAAGALKPAARKAPPGSEEFFLSNVLNHHVSTDRKAVLGVDLRRRPPDVGRLAGVICVPLVSKSAFIGLAFLDALLPEGQTKPSFTSADLRFAAALAGFAGLRLAQVRRLSSGARLGHVTLKELLAGFEKEVVLEALHAAKGDLDVAAKELGLKRPDFDARLKALGLVGP
ncbi:MAG TPA: FHA domain-containing protein, partial [Planctomycetota bacterium]